MLLHSAVRITQVQYDAVSLESWTLLASLRCSSGALYKQEKVPILGGQLFPGRSLSTAAGPDVYMFDGLVDHTDRN